WLLHPERCECFPCRNAREIPRLCVVVVAAHQDAARQHGRAEEWPRQERSPGFLDDHAQFREAKASSAKFFRNGQTLKPKLISHLPPHAGVITLRGTHHAAYC